MRNSMMKAAMSCCLLLCGMLAYAQPVISSLNVYKGIPGSQVIITGTGFNATAANNIVLFGATKAVVTTASATSLKVNVPVGATLDNVSVTNTANGLTDRSGRMFQPIFDASPYVQNALNFEPKVDVGFSFTDYDIYGLQFVTMTDVDGDGKADLVGYSVGNGIAVYRNISTEGQLDRSSFGAVAYYPFPGDINALSIADMDGDGKLDIVGRGTTGSGFSVLRNTATPGTIDAGSFAASVDIDVAAEGYGIAIGDVNSDGKMDVVYTSRGDHAICFYQNNSTVGLLSFSSRIDMPLLYFPEAVQLGDLNDDGHTDLIAIYTGDAGTSMAMFRNMGTGGSISSDLFDTNVDVLIASLAQPKLQICDIDGDGKQDVVYRSGDEGHYPDMYLYRNTSVTGALSMAAAVQMNFGKNAAMGDIDGDGKPDIVAFTDTSLAFGSPDLSGWSSISNGKRMSFYFNTATSGTLTTASFAAPVHLADLDGRTGLYPWQDMIAIGDLDGDKIPDLAFYSGGTYPAIGAIRHAPLKAPPVITSFGPATAKPGDVVTITGSGFNLNPVDNRVYFGNSIMGGTMSATATSISVTVPFGAQLSPITVINAATSLAGTSSQTFIPRFEAGTYRTDTVTFDPKVNFPIGGTLGGLSVLADIDADGKLDLVTNSSDGGASLSIYHNISTAGSITAGSFAPAVTFDPGTSPGDYIHRIFVKDIDQDNWPDVILTFSDHIAILKNNAHYADLDAGSLGAPVNITNYSFGTFYYLSPDIDICDVDGDGKPDIVGRSMDHGLMSSGYLFFLQNRAVRGTINASTFAPLTFMDGNVETDASSGLTEHAIKTHDIDGDGKMDVLLHGENGHVLSLFRNRSRMGAVVGVYGDLTYYSDDIIGAMGTAMSFESIPAYLEPADNNYFIRYRNSEFADIDGDGKDDLVLSDGPSIAVRRNTCTPGTLDLSSLAEAEVVAADADHAVANLKLGDMNGDGKPDIVASLSSIDGDSLSAVYLNISTTGHCAFRAPIYQKINSGAYELNVGDVDGDGLADIITSPIGGTFTVLRNHPGFIGSSTPITGPSTVCTGNTITLNNSTPGGTWSSSDIAKATVGSASGMVAGVAVGTTTITYHFSAGGNTTYTITVNAAPDAGTISGTATVCPGASITLGTTGTAGSWSSTNGAIATVGSSSGIVNGIAAGTATISYTVTNGCGTVAVTQVVTVNAAPDAGMISGTATVCTGATNTLSTTGASGVWSSTNGSIATVGSSTGVVSGVAAGTATISYTVTNTCGTQASTKVVTVNAAPDAGAISGIATICTGATTTLSTTGAGGMWSSTNGSIATVGSSTGVVSGVAAGTATISYTVTGTCGTQAATQVVTVNAATAAGTISGAASVCTGATTTLSTTGSDGAWSSADDDIATVGAATGIVNGVATGTVTISYSTTGTCGVSIATKVVTVNAQPGAITGTMHVCVGATTALSDAAPGGSWSSNTTSVATVGSTGIVSGVASGVALITYSGGVSCYVTTAVTVDALPAAITGTVTVTTGASATLSSATMGGTWTSGNTSIATIGSTTGIYTGIAPGSATMTYTIGSGCAATQLIAVTSPVNLDTSKVCVGFSITMNNYQGAGAWSSGNNAIATIDASTGVVTGVSAGNVYLTFTPVSGTYSTRRVTVYAMPNPITGSTQVCTGSTITLTCPGSSGTWSSSDIAIGTIGASSGIVGGISGGAAVIRFTAVTSGCKRETTVTVNAPLPTITGILTTCAGSTTTLGNSVGGGTWSSSIAAYATVGSATGIVTGIAAGPSTIKYIHPGGCQTSVVVTVSGLPAAIGTIPPLCAGTSATLTDATAGGTWSATNGSGSVSIVAATGVVTGLTPGTAIVSYSLGTGCVRTAIVTVSGGMAAISGSTAVCTGTSSTLTIAATGGVWTSSASGIASIVAGNGVMTGVAAGTATITYAVTGGCKATTVVTVNTAPGTMTGTLYTCVDATTTLTTTGTGAWSSSNTAIGTVDAATGVVTGVSAGTVTITRTGGAGCTRTANVTVRALPSPITGNGSICTSGTTTLIDAGNTGTWTSGNTSVANIGASSGVVTPISAGTVTITYTNIMLCRRTRVITVNASASAGVISGPSSVIVGDNIQLATTGVPGGVWTSSSTLVATVGSSTGNVAGMNAGTATISYAVNNGCGPATSTYVVTVATSRPGNIAPADEAAAAISIYPNPTTGRFTINITIPGILTVYTVDGKLAAQYDVPQGITMLGLPDNMANGVYMCRYNGNDGSTIMARLIYEK